MTAHSGFNVGYRTREGQMKRTISFSKGTVAVWVARGWARWIDKRKGLWECIPAAERR